MFFVFKVSICLVLIFSLALSNFLGASINTYAAEKIIYVDSSAAGANDGSSWKDAFTELQSALDDADEGKEIWISSGVYYPTKDIKGNASPSDPRTKSFQMKNGVSIFGGFPANDEEATFEDRDVKQYKTVLSGDLNKNNAIDGSDAYHVFYHPQGTFINGTALLDGVMISGGNANSYSVIDASNGGGMFNDRSHPKLNEVTIEKNQARSGGGGIYNENSNMHLENGIINGNESDIGAGFYNSSGNPMLNNIVVSGNISNYQGGGIYSQGGKLTISKGTIVENTSGSFGGGLNIIGDGQLNDFKVLNNKARSGAGMYIQGNSIVMENGEIAGNIAAPTDSGSGGGIYSTSGWDNTFNNINIHNNEAQSGGGVYLERGSDVYTNAIISNNKALNGAGISIMSGNPKFVESKISTNTASENGGGVLNNTAQPTFTNTAITSNMAKNGGGIYSSEGGITSLNSSLRGNEAVNNGGALYNYNSDLLVTNTLVSGNKAEKGGGFYENYADASKFTNATITGNTAAKGGAFYNSASNPTIQNSIIWNNDNAIHNSGSTPSFAYSLVQGSGGSESWNDALGKDEGGNLDADPGFVESKASSDAPTSEGNYSLAPDSEAIDKGSNEFVPEGITEDIDGNYREMGTAVDLGAYEKFISDTEVPEWLGNNGLYAYGQDKNSIELRWNPAKDNYQVEGYRIYVDDKLIQDIKQPTSSWIYYTVSNLQPNTTYKFAIEAYDAAGNTSKKLIAEGRTSREPDTEAPKWKETAAAVATEKTREGVEISWPEATDNQGISRYEVKIDDNALDGYGNINRTRIIRNLKPDTEYEFYVEAIDLDGNRSEPLKLIYKTLPLWPETAKLEFLEETESGPRLVWPETKSGLIQYFEIMVDGKTYAETLPSTNEYYMNNLTPGKAYEFTVNAVNFQDERIASLKVTEETLSVWSSDAELAFTENDQMGPRLTWPKSQSNLISRYKLAVNGKDVGWFSSDLNEHYLSNLIPDTDYEFTLDAIDNQGNIVKSLKKNYKTLPAWKKDAKLTFSHINQTSLMVEWPEIESSLANYVEISVDGEIWNNASGRTQEMIFDLRPGTEYEFMVRLFDNNLNPIRELKSKMTTAPYSDLEPPYWNYAEELKATEIKETSLKLLWPKASDNEGIKGYRIFVDNEQIADVDSSKTFHLINDLTKGTTYTIMVQAYDEKNNASFIRLGVQTASSSGGSGGSGGGQVIVLPPAPSVPQEPVNPTVPPIPENPTPTEPTKPNAPEEPIEPAVELADIKGHWAEKQIIEGIQKKMVNGYEDNTFKPDNQINRAEFTILLANALGLTGDGKELKFSDNRNIGPSARTAIKRAVEAGVVHGFEDGSFRPNQKITRMEMAAMIARAMKLEGDAKASTGFSDDSSIPSWARGAIAAMKETGVISGRGNNKFEPTVKATRAETVVMLLRMMKYEK